MAGHSKWANIKHRKAAQDKKRAKVWTRIIKEITIAARDGGPDLDSNPALRLAVQNGKGANLPKDTIERAIKKGSGAEAANLQTVTYEGYAPHGIAIFVEATTDNINRTVAAVRSIFTKKGGNLGTNGSLSFIFDTKGVFTIDNESLADKDVDELELELIDGGAQDVEKTDEVTIVYTTFDDYGNMQSKLAELCIESKSTEIQQIPKSTTTLNLEQAQEVLKMIDKFEDDDDVQAVYHNLELTEELISQLEG
ncbi:YebC/PmpR family DNA-binding transcriptional regulator [Bacteroidia bacterium]|jgi:YebC/PmpR family DNA-binding regulatory protein|nr:YebC/PmpR family DNA-binding transcriptional regulator [Bacteroidota bacterium]MDA8929912.1 YebC/PmpR family DNA-binding transcriptional regulator [Bacteroidia bacterium]MDA9111110.1 YebC/PmpR family DNA-binding transcriptional regulator [Bacteroidia bacterium]